MSDVLEVSSNLGIYLSGSRGLNRSVREVTVGDVRRWLTAVDKFGIGDDVVLEDCVLSIYVKGTQTVPIPCGEHTDSAPRDALVVLHECS